MADRSNQYQHILCYADAGGRMESLIPTGSQELSCFFFLNIRVLTCSLRLAARVDRPNSFLTHVAEVCFGTLRIIRPTRFGSLSSLVDSFKGQLIHTTSQ